MALQLGVSYLPLAEVCILALQLWTKSLSQEILGEHMPHVLPLLLPYLRSQGKHSPSIPEVLCVSLFISLFD